MVIPGIEPLVELIPALRSGRGWLIGLAALTSFTAATAVMFLVDRLWPAWTGVGQAAVILLGFAWAGQFFWRRQKYRARWGSLAYRHAFSRHILLGLPPDPPPDLFCRDSHHAGVGFVARHVVFHLLWPIHAGGNGPLAVDGRGTGVDRTLW